MRKILLSAALAAVCAMGVTAMASETATSITGSYVAGDNNYNATEGTSTAKTIIIYRGESSSEITGENIYYVDQAEGDSFGDEVLALMKANPTAGTYTVAVNGGKNTTFEISTGDAAVAGCIPTERLSETEKLVDAYGEEYCSVGFSFTTTATQFDSFTTIKSLVRAEEGTENTDWVATAKSAAIEWKEIPSVEGSVKCAIQVDWVPNDLAERFEVYLSTEAE